MIEEEIYQKQKQKQVMDEYNYILKSQIEFKNERKLLEKQIDEEEYRKKEILLQEYFEELNNERQRQQEIQEEYSEMLKRQIEEKNRRKLLEKQKQEEEDLKYERKYQEYLRAQGGNISKDNINSNNNYIAKNTEEIKKKVGNDINDKNISKINKENKEKQKTKIKEKPIGVNFISVDQNIHYPVGCFISDNFSKIEAELYEEYPELKNKKITFFANGGVIDKSATLEQNNIKQGTNILMNYN